MFIQRTPQRERSTLAIGDASLLHLGPPPRSLFSNHGRQHVSPHRSDPRPSLVRYAPPPIQPPRRRRRAERATSFSPSRSVQRRSPDLRHAVLAQHEGHQRRPHCDLQPCALLDRGLLLAADACEPPPRFVPRTRARRADEKRGNQLQWYWISRFFRKDTRNDQEALK